MTRECPFYRHTFEAKMKNKILGLFRGTPRPLESRPELLSAFSRQSVDLLKVHLDFIEGDEVANKIHHGGTNRVLHYYPSEHYSFWKKLYPDLNGHPGSMGENISSSGLDEKNVCIGDIFRIGEVEAIVTEPRKPCGTINLHFQVKGLARKVQEEMKTGWFFKIIKPGIINAGDEIELLSRQFPELTIETCIRALLIHPDESILNKMINNPVLSENWKKPARNYLEKHEIPDDRARLGDN